MAEVASRHSGGAVSREARAVARHLGPQALRPWHRRVLAWQPLPPFLCRSEATMTFSAAEYMPGRPLAQVWGGGGSLLVLLFGEIEDTCHIVQANPVCFGPILNL